MKTERVTGSLTPVQKRHVKKVQQQIAAELPKLIQRNQLAHDAMKEKTFSGVLRQAIQRSRILLPDLARRADVEMSVIADFLCGEQTLESDAIDRLVAVLKLKLPTERSKPRRAKAG